MTQDEKYLLRRALDALTKAFVQLSKSCVALEPGLRRDAMLQFGDAVAEVEALINDSASS